MGPGAAAGARKLAGVALSVTVGAAGTAWRPLMLNHSAEYVPGSSSTVVRITPFCKAYRLLEQLESVWRDRIDRIGETSTRRTASS